MGNEPQTVPEEKSLSIAFLLTECHFAIPRMLFNECFWKALQNVQLDSLCFCFVIALSEERFDQ